MRPVNLIPVEERRGGGAKMRGGPLAYIVVGALVALLAGVTLLVITSNQISTSKAEVTRLENENAAAEGEGRASSPPTPSSSRSTTSGSRPSPSSPTAASTGNG